MTTEAVARTPQQLALADLHDEFGRAYFAMLAESELEPNTEETPALVSTYRAKGSNGLDGTVLVLTAFLESASDEEIERFARLLPEIFRTNA